MKLLAALFLSASLSCAQKVIDATSFGPVNGFSRDDQKISGWRLLGSWTPRILSDKVILTPPHPGNQQGAIWAETSLPYPQWEVELDFRATGPEHGSGNLQLWYTKENAVQIGSNSLYTIEKFEGLVLVIDMHGGRGGSVRGFLNDGTIDFKNQHHLESLAFGHCDYSYRNLGRPSQLSVKQDSTGFEVVIDKNTCFRSNQVLLPSHNFFGLTASTADTPDSFEIFKFTTTVPSSWEAQEAPPAQRPVAPVGQSNPRADQFRRNEAASLNTGGLEAILAAQNEKFADVQDRFRSSKETIDNIYSELMRTNNLFHNEWDSLQRQIAKSDQITALEKKIQALEASIGSLRKEVEGRDYSSHLKDISSSIKDRHDAILEFLPETMHSVIAARAPNIGFFIFLVCVFQLILAAAYIVYKRRRATAPKKYL